MINIKTAGWFEVYISNVKTYFLFLLCFFFFLLSWISQDCKIIKPSSYERLLKLSYKVEICRSRKSVTVCLNRYAGVYRRT